MAAVWAVPDTPMGTLGLLSLNNKIVCVETRLVSLILLIDQKDFSFRLNYSHL